MIPTETGDRRAGWKGQLLERLHDPMQLRIFVIGAILAIGYGVIYMPLDEQIRDANNKLVKERKLAALATRLEALQTQCKGFEKRLPPQADSKEWIQYMLDGVRRFTLKLGKLDCLPPKNVGPYKAVILKLELEGTYYELDRFLRWVEANPRLLRVDDIDIALANKNAPRGHPSGKEQEANRDTMVMTLTVLGMGA
jgi:Tfp pilus assembly protein PilO